jgi:cytochrome c oxidase assembly protein subunit 15
MRNRRTVARWLLACCALLALLVGVGGVTRLTRSGLSIPEWRPVTGILPPIGEHAWEEAFAAYRETPEYRIVHHGMTLDGYRRIFLWEYLHRLLARLLGVAFALPLAYFAWRRRLPRGFGRPLVAILALGLLQGVAGWWMVASGLVDEPRVSHLRLTVHLGLALLLFAAMLQAALELRSPRPTPVRRGVARSLAGALVVAVFLQALAGALMAGSRAGYLYPTFPRMAGELVPSRLFAADPWPASLWRDLVTIHFVHRWSGIAIALLAAAGLATAFAVPSFRTLREAASAVAVLAAATAGLGIVTVLSGIAIVPAIVHQLLAVALLAAAIVARHRAAGVARYGVTADQAVG